VTHGAPPPSAVIPAEGGWATWYALTGTPQTDPAASVGFVSQHPQDDYNLFPTKDFASLKPTRLALFRTLTGSGLPIGSVHHSVETQHFASLRGPSPPPLALFRTLRRRGLPDMVLSSVAAA